MSKSNRVTKVTKEQRILKVQGWIIDGAQDDFMLRQMKTEWDLSVRQSRRYLKEAYNRFKPQLELDIETKRQAKIAEIQQDLRSIKPEYKGTPQGVNAKARLHKLIIKLEGIEPDRRLLIDANVKGSMDVPIDKWLKKESS